MVRRRVFTISVTGALLVLALAALVGIKGGTHNTLMSPVLLPSCIGVLVVAALFIGWWTAHARKWHPADAWREFTKLDWVQKFLYAAFPTIALLVGAFMAKETFTLVALIWPSESVAVNANVYNRKHVRQKDACPYQVSITLEELEWSNTCVSPAIFDSIKDGKQQLLIRSIPAGYVIEAWPNNRFQPTSTPPLRSGEVAAEPGR